jgi:hypothetical protein
MDLLEIRTSDTCWREPGQLQELLALQFALERAVARRAFLAPLLLVAGIPLLVSATGAGSPSFHRLSLLLFSAAGVAVIASIVAELRLRRALARACDRGGVRRSAL